MVCIIDYGLGNVGSLLNMCKRIGVEVILSSEETIINEATHLILPGVGTFDAGVKNLHERNLFEKLNKAIVENKKPILGICLGAQLMLQSSEEGELQGLGWLRGEVKRFRTALKVPHMGWNNLEINSNNILFQNLPEYPPRFYFVHSFHFSLVHSKEAISYTEYDYKFESAFNKDNIFGVQFHPEKSHLFGQTMLKNFLAYT